MDDHTHAPSAAQAQEGVSPRRLEHRGALLAAASLALGIASTLVLTTHAQTAVRFIDSAGAAWIRSPKGNVQPGVGVGDLSAAHRPPPRHDDAEPCLKPPHARPSRLLVLQVQDAAQAGVEPDVAERQDMTSASPQGLVEVTSSEAFAPTLERVAAAIENAGLFIFARIDHAAAASESGLQMPPTVVLIYGHAKGGTPIMLAAPSAAIELPLRVSVREGKEGQVVVSFPPIAPRLRALGVPAQLVERLEPAQRLILETVQGTRE